MIHEDNPVPVEEIQWTSLHYHLARARKKVEEVRLSQSEADYAEMTEEMDDIECDEDYRRFVDEFYNEENE
jgi:hypothetical protein